MIKFKSNASNSGGHCSGCHWFGIVRKLSELRSVINRGGTSRENPYRVGYWVRLLKSRPGPGRVYPMQIDKTPQYAQARLREYVDC